MKLETGVESQTDGVALIKRECLTRDENNPRRRMLMRMLFSRAHSMIRSVGEPLRLTQKSNVKECGGAVRKNQVAENGEGMPTVEGFFPSGPNARDEGGVEMCISFL